MNAVPTHHPDAQRLLTYATGAASLPLRLMMEAHLSLCPACAREMGRLSAPGGVLLEAVPEAPVSPELFARIWEETSRRQVPRPEEDLPLPAALLAELPPPRSWRWQHLLSGGSRVAHLVHDANDGSSLYLVHLPGGARFPHHVHHGAEETLVLSGRASGGGLLLDIGSWTVSSPGSEHELLADAREGCWALTRVEREGVRLSGWRGLLQRAHSHRPH